MNSYEKRQLDPIRIEAKSERLIKKENLLLKKENRILKSEIRLLRSKKYIPLTEPQDVAEVTTSLRDLEKLHIIKVMNYFQNDINKAAASLGVVPLTLKNKLTQYGIS